jgi:hypothetical protein
MVNCTVPGRDEPVDASSDIIGIGVHAAISEVYLKRLTICR